MEDVYIGNTENLVIGIAHLRTMLNRLGAAAPGVADAGLFNLAEIMLFKNDITPTKDTLLADLTPCDFTGYARSAGIAWAAAYEAESGAGEMVGGAAQFLQTGADPEPQSAYGYGIVDAGGTLLLAAERFPTPALFDGVGAAQIVIPKLALPRP